MILLFKGGYYPGGGSIFGLFGLLGFVLSILVILFLVGLAGTIVHKLFCKLTGISVDEKMPLTELYSRITVKTLFEEEYEGPLLSLLLWLVGLSGVAICVLLIILTAPMDSVLLTLACVFVFVPAFVFAFFLFRHFYPRFLYKAGRRAQWHLSFAIVLISVSWIVAVWMMIAQTPAYKMRQFDKVIESCEQSETVETEFFAGFRVGMTTKAFDAVVDSLCQEGLVRWDTSSYDRSVRLVYLGYDTPENYHCILKVRYSFYDAGSYLYHVGLGLMVGNNDAFWADVSDRLSQEGWRHLDLPEPYYDEGVRLPRHQVRMAFGMENLYNSDDEVYVKDNMLVVVRPFGVDFYDMPTYTKRPYWNYQ